MLSDKYIENNVVLPGHIASDVRFGRISHQDIIEILKDERVKKAFIGTHLEQKRPQSEWGKDYLDELFGMASMTCFNEDYLFFLEDVAKYVKKRKERKTFLTKLCVFLSVVFFFMILIIRCSN